MIYFINAAFHKIKKLIYFIQIKSPLQGVWGQQGVGE